MKTEPIAFTPLDDLRDRQSESAASSMENARLSINNIAIGLNTTVRVTRDRPERERKALRWLAAYIHREMLTAEGVCQRLDSDLVEIRTALTSSGPVPRALIGKIESLRAVLEMNLRAPAETQDRADIEEAFAFAEDGGNLVEFIALTRTGKTTSADWLHCQRLGEWVLVDVTSAESYAAFIASVAAGCGIAMSEGKKGRGPERIEAQIKAMFGPGLLKGIIFDEGHYLWPINVKLKPKRIEFVRKWWDAMRRAMPVFILSTPQSVLAANGALGTKSKRWSPGQWEGRVTRFFPTLANLGPEPTEEEKALWRGEAKKVARWHYPEGSSEFLEQMARFAIATPGFYGAMINALNLALFKARRTGVKPTLEILKAAQKQCIQGTPLGVAAAKKGGK